MRSRKAFARSSRSSKTSDSALPLPTQKNALVREKWYERFTGILKRYTGNLLRNLLVELGKRAWNTHEERCKRFKKR